MENENEPLFTMPGKCDAMAVDKGKIYIAVGREIFVTDVEPKTKKGKTVWQRIIGD